MSGNSNLFRGSPDQLLKHESRLLYYGDIVRINPDSLIPIDGTVLVGSGEVDESAITGESNPSSKSIGSSVVAGTKNLNGVLDICVNRLVPENQLATLGKLVREIQGGRSRLQDTADRVAAVILPIATAAACLAFLIWSLVSRFLRNETPLASGVTGLTYAIAVMAVSCPCALGLAVSAKDILTDRMLIYIGRFPSSQLSFALSECGKESSSNLRPL